MRYGLDRTWAYDRLDFDRVSLPKELRPLLAQYDITAQELLCLGVPKWEGISGYAAALRRKRIPLRSDAKPGQMLHVVNPPLYQQMYEDEMTRLALSNVPPPYDSLGEFARDNPARYKDYLRDCRESAYLGLHSHDEPVRSWRPDSSSFSFLWK